MQKLKTLKVAYNFLRLLFYGVIVIALAWFTNFYLKSFLGETTGDSGWSSFDDGLTVVALCIMYAAVAVLIKEILVIDLDQK